MMKTVRMMNMSTVVTMAMLALMVMKMAVMVIMVTMVMVMVIMVTMVMVMVMKIVLMMMKITGICEEWASSSVTSTSRTFNQNC